MPRPKDGYKLADGTKVPGVGDVVGRFKRAEGLIGWAYAQGKAGVPLNQRRDWAADVGTAVHDMIDADLIGDKAAITARVTKLDTEGQGKAMMAFAAWRNWAKEYQIKVIATEISLVSEQHRFGGTLDKIISINGTAPALIDFKTGKGVYLDQVLQIAAYKQLWEEKRPDLPLTGGFHVLHCNRDTGEFGHRYFPNVDGHLEQFLRLRTAYDADAFLGAEETLHGVAFALPSAPVALPIIEATPNVVAVTESDTTWLAARATAFANVRDLAAFTCEERIMVAARQQVRPEIFSAAATLAAAAGARLKYDTPHIVAGTFTRAAEAGQRRPSVAEELNDALPDHSAPPPVAQDGDGAEFRVM